LPQRRFARHDLFAAAGQSTAPKFSFHIEAADHSCPGSGNCDPRGDVGEPRGFLEIRVSGEGCSQRRDKRVSRPGYVGNLPDASG